MTKDGKMTIDVNNWRESYCEEHEKEMIDILKKAEGLL